MSPERWAGTAPIAVHVSRESPLEVISRWYALLKELLRKSFMPEAHQK